MENADNLNNSLPGKAGKNENFFLVIDKTVCEQENRGQFQLAWFCLSCGRDHICHQVENHRFYLWCCDKHGSSCKFGFLFCRNFALCYINVVPVHNSGNILGGCSKILCEALGCNENALGLRPCLKF